MSDPAVVDPAVEDSEPVEADTTVEDAPVEDVPAEEASTTPVITGGPPAPDQATRDAVAEAGADLQVGQTVVTDAAGNVTVTGTPAADPDAPADHTLTAHGDHVLIDTPFGRIEIRIEVGDDTASVKGTVSVFVTPIDNANALVSDAQLIRCLR